MIREADRLVSTIHLRIILGIINDLGLLYRHYATKTSYCPARRNTITTRFSWLISSCT